jgi:hypothetical protein
MFVSEVVRASSTGESSDHYELNSLIYNTLANLFCASDPRYKFSYDLFTGYVLFYKNDDAALASNLRTQAERMSNEAKGLLAEAQRLIDQATGLDPVANPVVTAGIKKTRGRPKKAPVTV